MVPLLELVLAMVVQRENSDFAHMVGWLVENWLARGLTLELVDIWL